MTQYITPAGYRVLREEFDFLRTVERPKVVQEVADAAAHGDRSENAEYIYGKRRLREIDRRLGFLNRSFAGMQVVDPKVPRGEKVFFGATVTLYDHETDDEVTYQIVGPLDTLDDAHVSYRSPVGQALLGLGIDDEATIHTPRAERRVTIVDIRYV